MRRFLIVALTLLVALGGMVWHLCARDRGPVYLGRSVAYWEREAATWEPWCMPPLPSFYDPLLRGDRGREAILTFFWEHHYRPPSCWPRGLEEIGSKLVPETSESPLLLSGDPAAVPVLICLLKSRVKSSDSNVALLAAAGLAKVGPKATTAVPALFDALMDEDEWVRLQAAQALLAVDPDAAEARGIGKGRRER